MIVLAAICALALCAGALLPLRWGVLGFVGAAGLLYVVQVGINTALGFEGTSIEDSLLLFNGSWAAYVGFNLQVSYRAFALPLLCLAVPLIFRLSVARV